MSDLTDKVRDIQVKIEAAQRARVRAEQDRESAIAVVTKARDALKQEFGVSTVEEAKAALARLEHEVQASIAEIDSKLSEIGG